jgi:hypothetical protein
VDVVFASEVKGVLHHPLHVQSFCITDGCFTLLFNDSCLAYTFFPLQLYQSVVAFADVHVYQTHHEHAAEATTQPTHQKPEGHKQG